MATNTQSSGRWFGVLVLVQIVGLIVPFVMLLPITRDRYWEIVGGGEYALQISYGVVLLLINCALTVVISLRLRPLLKERWMSATLVLLAVLMLLLQIADSLLILGMLNFSIDFLSDGASVSLIDKAKEAAAIRAQVHHWTILSIDLWVLAMYFSLIKGALVPRWVAWFGMSTALLHTFAITVPLLIGTKAIVPLGASMALGHLVLGVTILVKGLRRPDLPASIPPG